MGCIRGWWNTARTRPRLKTFVMTTSIAPDPGSGGTTTISSLPTELLVRLLSFLPAIDLLSARQTSRRIHNVITDSSYLQYILRIEINGVDDLLPPDCSITERLRLLRQHEKSWNCLQYNEFAEDSFTDRRLFIIQDGYLIYKNVTLRAGAMIRYGYVDLSSTSPKGELRWVHIPMQRTPFPVPLKLEFAVDYNLAVAISQPYNRATVDVTFLEFTTGAFHPLSLKPTVRIQSPLNPVPAVVGLQAEILGDYILIAVTYEYTGCYVSLIPWKTGTTTILRELFFRQVTEWRKIPRLVAIDNDLIAVVEDNTNFVEICRLELTPPDFRMETVCFLEMPPLKPNAFLSVSWTEKEWVSTLKHHPRSDPVRRRPAPFRSSKVSNIRFSLDYHIHSDNVYRDYPYTMVLSVAELLTNIRTDRRPVPWADWGPSRTRIFPRPEDTFPPSPAGPFWISHYSPLTKRDYDFLRARCPPSVTTKSSSSSSLSTPVFSKSKVEGEQWVGGAVETSLPYRDYIIPNLHFNSSQQVVADREWLVDISVRETEGHLTVYHAG
ncbi:hypothetical protein EDB83DRAFT_2673929 [Lactarius deliciosus]|nr:hypothetical protein EDB83DRAFT_2673929 [Lactarius deliciosus]